MKIRKNAWEEIVFLDIPLFLLGMNYVLYNALSLDSMKTLFRVGAILLLLAGWFLKGRFVIEKKAFLAMTLALIALLLNGSMALNFVVIVLFAICVTYPIDTIIKSACRINILLVLVMLVLMGLHVVNNTSYISTMGRLRYTLGFENPNVAALFYASAIYLFLVSREKINKRVIVFSFIATAVVYYYTNSRTSLLALLMFVALEGVFLLGQRKNREKVQIIMGKCLILFIDALFFINLASVFIIEKFMVFDSLLSFRISAFSRMINNSGLRGLLFGGTVETVDNFYYMLLFQYGIFIYAFVAISTHFAMKRMVDNKDIKYISLLVGLFLVGMMESSLIRPEILVTLIVWKIIFSSNGLAENNTIVEKGFE